MNNNALNYGVIGALVGGVIVWLLFTNVGSVNMGSMMNSGAPSRNTMMSAQIDAHFIEQMIPHHEDAITMANAALEKAKRPEIKQLAQNIITSQSAEISQMKSWYQDWFGRVLPTGSQVMQNHGMMSGSGMHMGMMGGEADMTRLAGATDFEKAFIEEMIPHHQMAVMMASMLKSGTERREMKKLADDIISAQSSEIEQMRQWYSAWSK